MLSGQTGVWMSFSFSDGSPIVDEAAVHAALVPASCFCCSAAEALLVVNILDVNDERPRFLAASYSFHVLENQAAGSLVGVVSAIDNDGAPYNQFSLSLLPAGSLSDAFSIDPLHGRLLTTRPLDRERQVSLDALFFIEIDL